MKEVINLKHWQGILFSTILMSSFITSKHYTDPFFVPKDLFFCLSSGIFILFICLTYLNRRTPLRVTFSIIDVLIFLFILFCFIRILFTPGIKPNNTKFYLIGINGAIYFFIKPFLSKENKSNYQISTIVNILLVIALCQVLYGFMQYFNIIPNLNKEFAIGGAFGNPGQYTNFITPLFSFTLAVFLFSKGKNKMLGLISSIGILLILPLTQARTSWIGAFFIVLYLGNKRFRILDKISHFLQSKMVRFSCVLLLLLIILLSAYSIYNYKKNSAAGRLFVWQVSLNMIAEKPLWGYGFDRFASSHNDHQSIYFRENPNDIKNALVADGVNYAFNEFIQETVETGIIGLVLLALLFIVPITAKKQQLNTEENLYFLAAKGCVIAFFFSSLFSYPLQSSPSLFLLYFSWAVIDAQCKKRTRNITLAPGIRKFFISIGLILIVFFIALQYQKNKAERDWYIVYYQLIPEKKLDEAYTEYRKLYPILRNSQYFLFNYGIELMEMNRYQESIKILKEAEVRLNDSDYYIYLGSNYENIGNNYKAEQCYLKASCIMPLKFLPKLKLINIYMRTGRNQEAINLAKNTMKMPVKIPSQTVTQIRDNLRQFISINECNTTSNAQNNNSKVN